jgi:hypothetical protein
VMNRHLGTDPIDFPPSTPLPPPGKPRANVQVQQITLADHLYAASRVRVEHMQLIGCLLCDNGPDG